MKREYVYPGSFCPPTYGHYEVVCKAAEKFPHVKIVCSRNHEKNDNWFSQKECQKMWQSYDLPDNVSVEILDPNPPKDLSHVIMIRGIRDASDFEHEDRVRDYNFENHGIFRYQYFICKKEHQHISSSKARELAENMQLQELAEYVSPMVISALLQKVLKVKNIFMVVGRPGSGKSTIVRNLAEDYQDVVHVNTDDFNQALKPLLYERFGKEDLIKMVCEREEELKAVIKPYWLSMLQDSLKNVQSNSHVFVEVPYCMQEDKKIYRYVGGNIICFDCGMPQENSQRVTKRGTPQIKALIERIPDMKTTEEICRTNHLELIKVDTSGSLAQMPEIIDSLAEKINLRRKDYGRTVYSRDVRALCG